MSSWLLALLASSQVPYELLAFVFILTWLAGYGNISKHFVKYVSYYFCKLYFVDCPCKKVQQLNCQFDALPASITLEDLHPFFCGLAFFGSLFTRLQILLQPRFNIFTYLQVVQYKTRYLCFMCIRIYIQFLLSWLRKCGKQLEVFVYIDTNVHLCFSSNHVTLKCIYPNLLCTECMSFYPIRILLWLFLITGFFLYSTWSWNIICAPDVFSWTFGFMILNLAQVIHGVYILRPVKLDAELEPIYKNLFEPLGVSLLYNYFNCLSNLIC